MFGHVCPMSRLTLLTVLDVFGADGLVKLTISCIASLNFSLWSGLLMPISRCISWSDRADMMAPLFTLARQAATYQAGIPTHNCGHRKTCNCQQEIVHKFYGSFQAVENLPQAMQQLLGHSTKQRESEPSLLPLATHSCTRQSHSTLGFFFVHNYNHH